MNGSPTGNAAVRGISFHTLGDNPVLGGLDEAGQRIRLPVGPTDACRSVPRQYRQRIDRPTAITNLEMQFVKMLRPLTHFCDGLPGTHPLSFLHQ